MRLNICKRELKGQEALKILVNKTGIVVTAFPNAHGLLGPSNTHCVASKMTQPSSSNRGERQEAGQGPEVCLAKQVRKRLFSQLCTS